MSTNIINIAECVLLMLVIFGGFLLAVATAIMVGDKKPRWVLILLCLELGLPIFFPIFFSAFLTALLYDVLKDLSREEVMRKETACPCAENHAAVFMKSSIICLLLMCLLANITPIAGQETQDEPLVVIRSHDVEEESLNPILAALQTKWNLAHRPALPYDRFVTDIMKYTGKKIRLVDIGFSYGEYELAVRSGRLQDGSEIFDPEGPYFPWTPRLEYPETVLREIRVNSNWAFPASAPSFVPLDKQCLTAQGLDISLESETCFLVHHTAVFTIKAFNPQQTAANDITVTLSFPAPLSYIASVPMAICQHRRPSCLFWHLPTIPAQSGTSINVRLQATAIANPAEVTATLIHNPSKLKKRASATVRLYGIPAMHISIYDTEEPVEVGSQTVYVTEAWNEGTSPCTGIRMTSRIPEEMEFVSAQGPTPYRYDAGQRQVIWEEVTIVPPGAKLKYHVVCKAIQPGSAKYAVTLSYDQFDRPLVDEEGTSLYDKD